MQKDEKCGDDMQDGEVEVGRKRYKRDGCQRCTGVNIMPRGGKYS